MTPSELMQMPLLLFVAKQIAEIAKKENYDLIFLGKETIDYNGAEVGAQLAELLDLPFFSFVNHLSRGPEQTF